MYEKNLTEVFRLRLSKKDMEFLRKISADRTQTVSECVRGIIGEYRRSLDTLDVLKSALKLGEEKRDLHGDSTTDIDDII